ncbi:hypothetical protein Tco_1041864 [Tanacetum coccineum]|uniref:Uncharacterized protein n=1 Tax=Tanacetum coccineum TaxID=301880 RepID=A0ABQ5GIY2_9ASTR
MMFNDGVDKVLRKRRKWDGPLMVVEVVEVVDVVEVVEVVLEEHLNGYQEKEDEVVSRVDAISLVDGVFDGAFGGDRDDNFSVGDSV